jgi:hypothetical protein
MNPGGLKQSTKKSMGMTFEHGKIKEVEGPTMDELKGALSLGREVTFCLNGQTIGAYVDSVNRKE